MSTPSVRLNVSWFSFPTRIGFGVNAIQTLPEVVKKAGYQKGLLVSDRGFAKTKAYERVVKTLRDANISFSSFLDVKGNPDEQDVSTGVEQFKKEGCQWILGVGGGSPLDVAKAIRLMVTHPGSIFDYDDSKNGSDRISNNVVPFVAIPTTAGTGSEVGRSTVIVNPKTKTKVIIFSPYLLANTVIADPDLTIDLPPFITAATGMDALTHNIEAYMAKGFHPLADSIALGGIRLVAKSIVKACQMPTDLEARGDMLMASMMGAIAFQKGLGVAHSLAHPLSTLAGMHHGLANGIVLPAALLFNREVAENRLGHVGEALGARGSSISGNATGAIEKVVHLRREIGIPETLTEAGVPAHLTEALAAQAYEDVCWQSNPRPVTLNEFRRLYESLFEGKSGR